MAGRDIRLNASDSGDFGVHLALPDDGRAKPAPGIVLLHEILGVTGWVKATADLFAAQGYCVAAPEMFWRLEPNFIADFRVPEERAKGLEYRGRIDHAKAMDDIATTIAHLKSLPTCNGRIGVTGFCTGGTLAYLAAARLAPDAAAAYYGTEIHKFLDEAGDIACPTILHAGTRDGHVPLDLLEPIKAACASNPTITIHEYDAGHAFCNDERDEYYIREASDAAHARTFALFDRLHTAP